MTNFYFDFNWFWLWVILIDFDFDCDSDFDCLDCDLIVTRYDCDFSWLWLWLILIGWLISFDWFWLTNWLTVIQIDFEWFLLRFLLWIWLTLTDSDFYCDCEFDCHDCDLIMTLEHLAVTWYRILGWLGLTTWLFRRGITALLTIYSLFVR